jgi:hypothetical protein
VRIRQKGYKDQNFFVSSYDAANDAITHIESERRRSLFIDYTTAHQVTLAELMQRYMQDKVCRKHKGAKVEAWTLKGFIADSKNELAKALEARERCLKEGKKPPVIRAREIDEAAAAYWYGHCHETSLQRLTHAFLAAITCV